MGRRPNPLVVEFFERGAKLEDKTNRYEHRCKKCGELFPKGRSDALTSHLLRKCPNVTQEDREWVFDQLQQTPDKSGARGQPPSSLTQNVVHENLQSGLALHNLQQQSALDTLAEVSRHHLDYSAQRGFVELFQEQRSVEPINEQAIIAQLREGGVGIPVTTTEPDNLYLYTTDSEPHQLEAEVSFIPNSSFAASPLVQTASAANQQLEQARTQDAILTPSGAFVDPQLGDMGAPLRSDAVSNDKADQQGDTMVWDSTPFGETSFGTLTMQTNGDNSFRPLSKGSKQKTRAHFNDTRRKEVQDIRKKGACLRCRMLKKPCSGETPCSTCKTVESARLWKGKCLRTRVADEFGLWSTSLFYTKAKIEVPAAVHGLEQQVLPGRVEARFFSGSNISVSFPVKAYGETVVGVDPNLHSRLRTNEDSQTIWLLDEGDTVPERLESYAASITEALISSEESEVTRSTLSKALAVIMAEEIDQTAKAVENADQKSPRSCYSLQNQLLKNVVELWVHTKLLASPSSHPLQLRYNPRETPRHVPEEIAWVDHNGEISSLSKTYQLIRSQFLAAIESRCSKLSKTVMNELERRLLQRQQVSRFATFLSAVILLSAVEIMTCLYRSFDLGTDQSFGPLPGKENYAGDANPTEMDKHGAVWGETSYHTSNAPSLWPLDTPSAKLWPQGPHFADLLMMLLRMRALPPKTCVTSDGFLAALQDYSLPVHMNGRPVKEQTDDQMKAAAEWLDPLQLKVPDLMQKRDGPLPGPEAGMKDWELRFVAKVLLPERIR